MAVQESKLVIVIDSKNALKTTNEVAMGLENLTKKGDQADAQMNAMSASIKSLVGYMGGLLTINKAITMADGYTQMAARIRNATASAEEYTLVQDRLLDTANGTYRALSEAQEVYLATSGGLKELGYSTKEALDISDSLSYSFVHNATSADKAKSAMDAYGKILDKGKVEADAWFSLMAAVPNILTDVANATGKSTAEIRKLGATGQLAARDLHQGFLLSRDSNNQLADAMENSLADGFMKLNNAVTVYLGKANETTSATGILADGLGVLAKNLDLVASAVAAAGLGYATTALLAKSAAVKQSLVDSAARRAADQVEMQSQVQLAAIEVQRARQITALAAQEIHLARQELNSATTRQARAAATMRLTQAEVALNIATKNTTTATAAYSAAQGAATATSLTLAGAARSALAFMTGPVGLGITVATVAAGYLLLGNNSEKSTASLRENNEAVGDAITKYRELNSVQQTNQLVVEKEKLEALEKEYTKISSTLMIYATNMGQANDFVTQSQIELEKLFKEYQKTGDLEKFTQAVQSSGVISQKTKDEVAKLASSVDQAGESAKKQKSFIAELGNNTQTAGNQASSAAAQYRDLAEAVSSVTKGLNQQVYDAAFVNKLEKMGKSSQSAERWLETYKKNAEQGVKGITAEQKVLLNSIDTIEKQAQARVEAQRKASQASNKAAKDSASEAKRQAKENERIAAEQYDAREQIAYRYADRNKKIETDLANEIKEIQEANFAKPEQTQGFIENAKRRASIEKELYAAQLAEQLNEWQDTEEKKLDRKVLINELMIQLDADMHDDVKKQAMKSLVDQSNHELALIKLSQETRLFQLREYLMSETAAMQERYRLEREQILLNSKLSEEQKQREISLSKALQEEENRRRLNNAVQQWGGIQAEMNGTGDQYRLEQERFGRLDASEELFDSQLALAETAAEREAIWQAHHDRMTAIESDYYSNSQALQIAGMGQIASGLTSIVGDMAGEQSLAYKAMFAVEKGFAIAQSALAIQTGVSKAMALGFPQNIPVIAQTVMEGAKITSAIKSITDTGFANGGYTGPGGKYEVAGVVHKDEGVLTKEEIKALGGPQGFEDLRKSIRRGYATGGLVADTHRVGMGAVSAINSGRGSGEKATMVQPIVNVHTLPGETADVSWNNGQLDVRIRKIARETINSDANDPNSGFGKAMGRNFNITRKR